jgi:transmembrane sensor
MGSTRGAFVMTRFDDLGRHLAREQDALRARSNVRAEVRARLDALELPEVQRRSWLLWLGAPAAASCVAAALVLLLWPGARGPQALEVRIGEEARLGSAGTWVEAPEAAAVAMRFSDGTRVDVAPESRARIAELSPNGAHLLLENGLVQVHVKHRAQAAWRISAGPFAVKVTGTRFDVRWNPEQDAFELDLREGHVEISGCVFGQSYELNAGQRAIASCRQGRLRVGSHAELAAQAAHEAEPAPAAPAPAVVAAPAAPPPPAANPSPATQAKPAAGRPAAAHSRSSPAARTPLRASDGWRALAKAGRYADALAAAHSSGFAAECRRADPADLILLSDLARYGRDYDDAAAALRLLRQRFAGSRQAAQAAFALGKLEFDQDGSYAEAAGWFRTYLRERPGGALAREASGRLLEATVRSGDNAAARELAAQYLRDFPNGPHAALANSLR